MTYSPSRLAVSTLLALVVATGPLSRPVVAQVKPPREQPTSYEALGEAGRWDLVMSLAEQRLSEEPGEPVALAWAGRASYEEAVSLSGGDEFSRDLGRALLERAVGYLGQAVAEGGEALPPQTREWWYAARLERGNDEALTSELERAWSDEGLAYAAFLRGWMAWEELADPDRSDGVSRVPDGEVISWLRRASDAEPTRATFSLVLSEALAASGDRVAAAASWERALDGAAEVETLLGTLLSIYPGEDNAAPRLARLERMSRGRDATSPTLAWAEAHALDQLGRTEDAERAFGRVAEPDRRSPAFDRAHARLLMRLERYDEAVVLMEGRAAARDWDSFTVLLDIADTLGLARRWDESLAVYDAAIAIEHRDERAARNRAITLWRAGRAEQAREAWAKVLALLPGRSDILNDAALASGGAGDEAEERRLLEEAITLPGSDDSRENLAAWHLQHPSGQRSEAVRLLDQVLAIEPDRDRALYLRFLAGRPR